MPEDEQAAEGQQPTEGQQAAEGQQPTEELKNTVTIEEAGPCKKKVIIEIPEETLKKATDEQYETLRKEALVPGFRKGRAPRRLLEKRFGKETAEQIKLKLLADASQAALKDNELNVLRDPDIDYENIKLPETGPFKFDFEVEVRPEFDLPKLEAIPVTRTKLEVTDQQVDRELDQLRRWAGVWTPRHEGSVQLDDQIIADATLKVQDVEEEEKLDNIEIFVRPKGFVGAVPVENLDDLLVGAGPGDTKHTTVDVPKAFFREEYRGKKVDISIEVKDIKFLRPAPLDENFFARYGADDEPELREKVRDSLQNRSERQARIEMTEQIYKYLFDNTDFDLPVDIVADHAVTLLQRQYGNLLMRGMSREQIDEQMEQLQAASDQQAGQQLKTFFIMDKVADRLEIKVSDEEINGRIAQLAIQRGQRPERMREEMTRDGSLAQFKLQVREDKCISRLLETATITEVEPRKETETAKKAIMKTARKTASTPKKRTPKKKTTTKKKTKE